jgi:hypothetical protein
MSDIITREWAMPSADTFAIKPIAQLLKRYLKEGDIVIDPFARNSQIGTLTNDLNPNTKAHYHLPAEEFCELLREKGIVADAALYDPPYSPRQIKECYASIGLPVTQQDTQCAHLYAAVKDGLDRLLRPGGIAISFGWNSVGFGKKRGYERLETMLVCHGGAHYDTIVVVEEKAAVRPVGRRNDGHDAVITLAV